MEVRLPRAEEDTPRWPTVAIVGVVSLAIGLGIAWWGMDEDRSARPRPNPEIERSTEPDPGAEREAESASGPEAAAGSATGSESEAGSDTESEAGSDTESGPDTESGSDTESGPDTESEAGSDTASGSDTESASDTASETGSASESAPGSEPERGTPGELRFVRGRIAYLRCDGAGRPGRACPRDEAMEDRVWAILARLPDCATPPPAAGEADLRLAWEDGGATDVLWRDTFADDVVRLDEGRVLACSEAALRAIRPAIRASRLFVSFRFSLADR